MTDKFDLNRIIKLWQIAIKNNRWIQVRVELRKQLELVDCRADVEFGCDLLLLYNIITNRVYKNIEEN